MSLKDGTLKVEVTWASRGSLCDGCVFQRRVGACDLEISERDCVKHTLGVSRIDYIYIKDTPEARAAYVARKLES